MPIGLIQSAFGGTMIESWLGADEQLACSNITCTSNQSQPFTRENMAECLASGTFAADSLRGSLKYPDYLASLRCVLCVVCVRG